jgi:hypothetical protein
MEVVGAVASFIAIGQAISTTIETFNSFKNTNKEFAALVTEVYQTKTRKACL